MTADVLARVKMNPKLVEVLKQIKIPCTTEEIINKLGWDWYWVALSLKELGSAGLVELVGSLYRLTDLGKKILEKIEAIERMAELPEV